MLASTAKPHPSLSTERKKERHMNIPHLGNGSVGAPITRGGISIFPVYLGALKRIVADPRFKGRRVYAYNTSRYSPEMVDFIRFLVNSDF